MSDLINEVRSAVEESRWDAAAKLLAGLPEEEYTDMTAILRATVLIARENYQEAEETIYRGIRFNPCSYELYLMLGQLKQWSGGLRQAFFCYAQAVHDSAASDRDYLMENLQNFMAQYPEYCKRVRILLLHRGTETGEDRERSLNNIVRYCAASTYEIEELPGGSGRMTGCNRIIELAAAAGQDVLLLDGNYCMAAHSLFNLCMALYERQDFGAMGAVSNHPLSSYYRTQYIHTTLKAPEDIFAFALNYNAYNPRNIETRIRLDSSALLLKAELLRKDCRLDMRMKSMEAAVEDLCLRLLELGYRCGINWAAFLCALKFHEMEKENFLTDWSVLSDKWGLYLPYYVRIRQDLTDIISRSEQEVIRVLEIGCGAGSTLLHIRHQFPNTEIYGVELNEGAARIAAHFMKVIRGDIEKDELPYPTFYFDYIVLGDVLEHLCEPGKALEHLKKYLNGNGCFLASIPNMQHYSASIPLLFGKFEYQDAGVLDRTHLRFFTLQSIKRMFEEAGCHIIQNMRSVTSVPGDAARLIDQLTGLDPRIQADNFSTLQYLIKAERLLGAGECGWNPDAFAERQYENHRLRYSCDIKRKNAAERYAGRRGAAYTVITGDYEMLKEPEIADERLDYICFTDNPDTRSNIWRIVRIENEEGLDPVRLSRKYKILCYQYLSDYDYSVYVDAKMLIRGKPSAYIERYSLGSSLLCFPHYMRDDIYEEAQACLKYHRDSQETIERQMSKYRAEGFPGHYGLTDNAVMVRDHRDGKLKELMDFWWKEFMLGSKRDQLCFTYCCWKLRFVYDLCDLYSNDNPYFYLAREYELV